jgi:1-acyl-sn-glycerol-3-phosphate acyltransferase
MLKLIILFPFKFIYKIYLLICFVLLLILIFPFLRYYLSKKERFPSAFKLSKLYGKLFLFFSGIVLKVKGRENIVKDKPFLICSNHSSFLDIPCLYSIFNQYFIFTGKKEIENLPLFHIFYTSGMNILIDRHNKMGLVKAFKRMMAVIEEGHPLVILPEGTISKVAPKLGEFKTGSVTLAIQKQIPILPITFTTNWIRLQRKGLFKGKASPGISEVIIHPIISTIGLTKENAEELQLKLRDIINLPLNQKFGV